MEKYEKTDEATASSASYWLRSWAGRRGYRAPPGNQFLIYVSRLEKYHRQRFAMLKS